MDMNHALYAPGFVHADTAAKQKVCRGPCPRGHVFRVESHTFLRTCCTKRISLKVGHAKWPCTDPHTNQLRSSLRSLCRSASAAGRHYGQVPLRRHPSCVAVDGPCGGAVRRRPPPPFTARSSRRLTPLALPRRRRSRCATASTNAVRHGERDSCAGVAWLLTSSVRCPRRFGEALTGRGAFETPSLAAPEQQLSCTEPRHPPLPPSHIVLAVTVTPRPFHARIPSTHELQSLGAL